MSISRVQAIETGNNVPKVDIDSTKNNIPKVPVDLQGGASPIDLQSIIITENGTTNAPEGVAYNEVIVDVEAPTPPTPTVYEPTYIKFQKYFREPEIGHVCGPDESLVYTDWVYLESAGATVVPSFPNDGLATKTIVSDIQNPTFETITNATIFYCFSSDTEPRARGSYPNEITYTQTHNQQVAPTKIYSYIPGGAFEWTEITIDTSTWDNKGYNNYIDRIIYAPVDIMRNTVSSIVFYQLQNLIGESGKISDPYKTDYYDVYYCSQGTQTNELNAVTVKADIEYIGNMTLLGMYQLLTSGDFPPTTE